MTEEMLLLARGLLTALHKNPERYDLPKIEAAYALAYHAHEGQKRQSGDPYISHPLAVAESVAGLGLDTDTVCAALLHDTVEDCENITLDTLRREFGEEVARLVDGVTKLQNLHLSGDHGKGTKDKNVDRLEMQAENLRKMFLAMAKDVRVIVIKLADRLHNMRSLNFLSYERQQRMASETLDIYAPLAGRLGISQIKCELEDLCLKYLDPEFYEMLVYGIREKLSERKEFEQTSSAKPAW